MIPPRRSLRWIEATLGRSIVTVEAVRTARTCALDVVTVDGLDQRFVLRRFSHAGYLAEHPEPVEREVRAFELMELAGVPTPALVAADPTGEATGEPASLVTFVAGSTTVVPPDWLATAVDVIERLRTLPLDAVPWSFRRYAWDAAVVPPAWATDRRLWERAIAIVEGWEPTLDTVAHRDFHQANTLWRDDGLAAVVDWDRLCRGPRGLDAAHFRLNLFLDHGPDLAARLEPSWRDPMCELADACDWLPFDDDERGVRLEEFVAAALAELGS